MSWKLERSREFFLKVRGGAAGVSQALQQGLPLLLHDSHDVTLFFFWITGDYTFVTQ